MSLANRKVDEMPTFRKGFLILLVLYHIPTCIATLRQRGMLAETAVLNRFVELGYEVLIPWGGYQPYDLAYVQPGTTGLFSETPPELIRVIIATLHQQS